MLTASTIERVVQRVAAAAYAPVKIILFGSYARGDADEGSDLDLTVVEKDIPDPAQEYLRLHSAVGHLGVGVDVLIFTEREFNKRRDWWSTPVFSAVREGKVMYDRT
ncbi:MAG: nucleotidyltransferase domain-containing protein [Sulfuricellaceae bacterium]